MKTANDTKAITPRHIRWLAAHHEAGHCVVALEHRSEIKFATIEPLGNSRGRVEWRRHVESIDLMAVLAAGDAATEHLCAGATETLRKFRGDQQADASAIVFKSDLEQMWELQAGKPEVAILREYVEATARATALLENNWRAVALVALELFRNGTVDGDRIASIYEENHGKPNTVFLFSPPDDRADISTAQTGKGSIVNKSFKALEVIEANRQAQANEQLAKWRDLMSRLVSADDLSNAEAIELDSLHSQLSITPPLIEYVALASDRLAKLDAPKKFATAEKKLAAAQSALDAHGDPQDPNTGPDTILGRLQAKHRDELGQHAVDLEKLKRAKNEAEGVRDQAHGAQQTLAALDKQLWQLVALRDPAIVASEQAEHEERESHKFYITRLTVGVGDNYRATTYPVMYVDSIVFNRSEQPGIAKSEFVLSPGQDADELAYLANIVRTVTDGPQWQYLADESDQPRVKTLQHAGQMLVQELAQLLDTSGRFDPSTFRWMRLPGESQAQLDRKVSRLIKAHAERYENSEHTRPGIVGTVSGLRD